MDQTVKFLECQDYNGTMIARVKTGKGVVLNVEICNAEGLGGNEGELVGREGTLDIYAALDECSLYVSEEDCGKNDCMPPISLASQREAASPDAACMPGITFSGKVLEAELEGEGDYRLLIRTDGLEFNAIISFDGAIEAGDFIQGTARLYGNFVEDSGIGPFRNSNPEGNRAFVLRSGGDDDGEEFIRCKLSEFNMRAFFGLRNGESPYCYYLQETTTGRSLMLFVNEACRAGSPIALALRYTEKENGEKVLIDAEDEDLSVAGYIRDTYMLPAAVRLRVRPLLEPDAKKALLFAKLLRECGSEAIFQKDGALVAELFALLLQAAVPHYILPTGAIAESPDGDGSDRIRNSRPEGNDAVAFGCAGEEPEMLTVRLDDWESITTLLGIKDGGHLRARVVQDLDFERTFLLLDNGGADSSLLIRYAEQQGQKVVQDVDGSDADVVDLVRVALGRGTADAQELTLKYNPRGDGAHAGILSELGFACADPDGPFEQDDETALALFKTASKRDDPDGLNALGWALENGIACEKDAERAVEVYTKAAELGKSAAMLRLGRIYEYGGLGEPNYAECLKWYCAAAAAGDQRGLYRLAVCCRLGRGTEKNDAVAFQIFRALADAGDAGACFFTAAYYDEGKVVKERDPKKALEYYKKGATLGDCDCLNNLGIRYITGEGVREDPRRAMLYFELAARAGSVNAWVNIARMYELGILGKPDLAKAKEYYSRSAAQGDKFAAGQLERLNGEQIS